MPLTGAGINRRPLHLCAFRGAPGRIDMRLRLIIACVVCSLTFPPSSEAAAAKRKRTLSSKQMGLVIRVEGGGWGSARRAEIETLLYSVADELLTHVPKMLTSPIVVTHAEHYPAAL